MNELKPTNSGYDPAIHPKQIEDCLARGMTKAMAARELGVCVRTVRNWELRHPEFLAAVESGSAHADSVVQEALWKVSTGYKNGEVYYPPNITGMIFWLKNRRPDEWRERKEINVTMRYSEMTEEEINSRIIELLEDEQQPAA